VEKIAFPEESWVVMKRERGRRVFSELEDIFAVEVIPLLKRNRWNNSGFAFCSILELFTDVCWMCAYIAMDIRPVRDHIGCGVCIAENYRMDTRGSLGAL
jgi:hypothetical protein